jgi:hypothetical protein
LASLTAKRIRDWFHGLAAAPARVRTAPGDEQRLRHEAGDHDARRRRRATANRVLTILKAALNLAKRDKKVAADDAWRDVKLFPDVDAPVVRYLAEDECARLVNATAEDFRPMVRPALLTGCRYGELVALRASDPRNEGRAHSRDRRTAWPRAEQPHDGKALRSLGALVRRGHDPRELPGSGDHGALEGPQASTSGATGVSGKLAYPMHSIIVCGGRNLADKALVFATLDAVLRERGHVADIHGAAPGADTRAGDWASERHTRPLDGTVYDPPVAIDDRARLQCYDRLAVQPPAAGATSAPANRALVVPAVPTPSSGCGSRGGPGYRLANGRRASWEDFRRRRP